MAAKNTTIKVSGFNPCFNGFMDKDRLASLKRSMSGLVSTLVLMDSWIKTSTTSAALF